MTKRATSAKTSMGRASAAERGPELYETDPKAVRALMARMPDFFAPRMRLWDPACGPGAILEVLDEAGCTVLGSDLHDYEARWRAGAQVERHWGRDFLGWTPRSAAELRPDAIIMNPPYSMADAFVDHALTLVPRVFALLELRWLNGVGRERSRLIDGGHIHAQLSFDRRLNMHRDGYDGPKNRQSRLHAWFLFMADAQAPGSPWVSYRLNLPLGG
ncbi:class I SAM-dependent methyltransferase [Hyphomonas sp.]|uniref:class I SAM-dependent methyltransferase n=1 Tax=Hyphomonas sp. TaxID=87 RepID=UPI00391DB68B